MSHPYAAYWNQGEKFVPTQTGAAALMDARDIPVLAEAMGLSLPFGRVLDVGCGTGRVARYCTDYTGVDISADACYYCEARHLTAHLIDGPSDLMWMARDYPEMFAGKDLVLCMSVFTHIDMTERTQYLSAFRNIAPMVLVDIIVGDGRGDVALWTCDPEAFAEAVEQTGWTISRQYEKNSPEVVPHRYYLLTESA